MFKVTLNFAFKLLGFTLLLCAIHYYIFINFFSEVVLYLPLWGIYLFNALLVLIVYTLMKHKVSKGNSKTYSTFLLLMLGKMALAIIFLLPLFVGKSEHPRIEVINFFIPYFLFLSFEIMTLYKFLRNQ